MERDDGVIDVSDPNGGSTHGWRPHGIVLFAPNRERGERVRDRLQRMIETAGLELRDRPAGPDDLVLSLGGDGTFLEALRQYHDVDPVFCGVNVGNLGFLQEVDEDTLVPALDQIVNNRFTVEAYGLLAVARIRGQREERLQHAFNDIVLERRDTRTLRMTLRIDGNDLGPMVGDGLLVSTAGGSTAYAFSARGAVIHPACPVLQVVALHVHRSRLTHVIDAPLVVPDTATIEVEVEWSRHRRPRIVIDGEEGDIESGELLRIRRSDRTVRVLRLGMANFWERLRTKFL